MDDLRSKNDPKSPISVDKNEGENRRLDFLFRIKEDIFLSQTKNLAGSFLHS